VHYRAPPCGLKVSIKLRELVQRKNIAITDAAVYPGPVLLGIERRELGHHLSVAIAVLQCISGLWDIL